ncbi:hypothetical protein CYMTET_12376 [Cymbomonas tetramitiformis]|uniref:HAT C-terminal dimerisation domain-containing protein n=1 Tax=Cymbomonas tetramitiformis TaxID=36881 RepID=A0AAE0GKS6_9CHLO|nr:hypothetical protein CYMTET_12376 [Cymbomonas tetramitiformis]|eukprot:gene6764-biopygen6811
MHASDLLQGTKYATVNLIMPIIGKVAYYADENTQLKYEKETVRVANESVKHARKIFNTDLIARFFNSLQDCNLEDWCVATAMDPRYKDFEFRNVSRWRRGTLTAEQAVRRARDAWEADWKPKPESKEVDKVDEGAQADKKRKGKGGKVVTVACLLADSDEEEDASETVELSSEEESLDELTKYLAYPKARANTDPLAWWRVHKAEFPHLAKMARQEPFLLWGTCTAI